jgi:hypothetical protein
MAGRLRAGGTPIREWRAQNAAARDRRRDGCNLSCRASMAALRKAPATSSAGSCFSSARSRTPGVVPARITAKHQSLLHLAGQVPWPGRGRHANDPRAVSALRMARKTCPVCSIPVTLRAFALTLNARPWTAWERVPRCRMGRQLRHSRTLRLFGYRAKDIEIASKFYEHFANQIRGLCVERRWHSSPSFRKRDKPRTVPWSMKPNLPGGRVRASMKPGRVQ